MALVDVGTLKELFLKIGSVYGAYACFGDHDTGSSHDRMTKFPSEADVRILQDETVVTDSRLVLTGGKDSFPVGGQGERRGSLRLPERTEDLPVIAADHRPGNIRDYGKETDPILYGYTRERQMLPSNLVTDAIFDVDYGYYRTSIDSPQITVTSGAGT